MEHTSLEGPGEITSSANPAIEISGRNITLERFQLDGPGVGIEFVGSLRSFLRDLQINSGGDGLRLTSGAGLWASGLHFNGTPGNATYAVKIFAWDTAFFSDILSEEHDGGFRIGSGSAVGNLMLAGIFLDRLNTVGILVEPSEGGIVTSLQVVNLWAHGGEDIAIVPMLLNGQEGIVSDIEIINGRFAAFDRPFIWIAGLVQKVRLVNLIFDQ